MTYFLLYVILRLNAFIFGVLAVTFIPAIYYTILGFYYLDDYCEGLAKKSAPYFKKALIFITIGLVFFCFIPSTKQAATIIIAGKALNNEKLISVPDKALDILLIKMQEYLDKEVGK